MIFQIVDIGFKKWQSSANSKGFNNRDHSYDSLSQTPLSSCLRFWFYRFIKDFSFRNINWGSVFFSFYLFVFTILARVSGLKQLECLMPIFRGNYKKSFFFRNEPDRWHLGIGIYKNYWEEKCIVLLKKFTKKKWPFKFCVCQYRSGTKVLDTLDDNKFESCHYNMLIKSMLLL